MKTMCNNVEIEAPETEEPAFGTEYFTPANNVDGYFSWTWQGTIYDDSNLMRGMVHLSREAAIAHGEALKALQKNHCGL